MLALLLAYSGALYVAQTTDLQDLLLDALALELILRMDELIFHAFCPAGVHAVV